MAKKNTDDFPKMERTKKTKWITFILYPDNRYHMQYLEWIKKNEVGFYIEHEPDVSEKDLELTEEEQEKEDSVKKRHYHVATFRNVQRTNTAFVKNMPSVDYHVTEWGSKIVKKKLKDGQEIEQEVAIPLKMSCIIPSDAKKEDIVTRPLVSSAQNVNDIYALSHYFIHDTFKCDYLGKKKYNKDEVKMLNNERKVFDDCFKEENDCSTSDYLGDILAICVDCNTRKQVVNKVASTKNEKLVKWFIVNSNFVLNWIFNDDIKRGGSDD